MSIAIVLLALLAQAATPDFRIVPGQRFGPVGEDTTRAALATLIPAATVVDRDIHIGEGFCTPGTSVYVGAPDELDIAWQDAARTRVAFVRVTTPGGRWTTARGVRVGTLLTELEKLQGSPIEFSGFGWDYGGGSGWSEDGGQIGIRLAYDVEDAPLAHQDPASREIFGDRPVKSDHPLIRRLRVRVSELIQTWGPIHGERFCG
jgi:hypothetical protein